MSRLTMLIFAVAMLTAPATHAHALCSGGTVAQEFREATIVVRARLVSRTGTWDD